MNLGTMLQNLLNTILTDEKGVVLPALATLVQNIIKDKTALNRAAQFNLFLSTVLAAQGQIESDVLQQILALVQGQIAAAAPAAKA